MYRVEGRNPDGSRYRGRLDVEARGDEYSLRWQIAGSAYSGTGKLEGGLLSVDWGSDEPIIHAVRADGTLAGLWQSGRGSETDTPQ